MTRLLQLTILLAAPVVCMSQLTSANYKTADNGSLTHGGLSASANIRNAIVNVWWDGHEYGSPNNTGQSGMPGGFVFPCVYVEPPVITKSGDTLISSLAVSYQWFYNGNIINGATGQTFMATLPGTYAVVITDERGCTASSAVVTVGIEDSGFLSHLVVYPNPASTEVEVEWESSVGMDVNIEVLSLVGSAMFSQASIIIQGRGSITISVSAWPTGVYLVRIVSSRGERLMKLAKI